MYYQNFVELILNFRVNFNFEFCFGSSAEVIDNYDPTLICLVETYLTREEQIQILGYKMFRNDGTANNKSILIAIKEKIKTIAAVVNREDAIG